MLDFLNYKYNYKLFKFQNFSFIYQRLSLILDILFMSHNEKYNY